MGTLRRGPHTSSSHPMMSTSGSMSARVRRVTRRQSCKRAQSDNEHSFSGMQSVALQDESAESAAVSAITQRWAAKSIRAEIRWLIALPFDARVVQHFRIREHSKLSAFKFSAKLAEMSVAA